MEKITYHQNQKFNIDYKILWEREREGKYTLRGRVRREGKRSKEEGRKGKKDVRETENGEMGIVW